MDEVARARGLLARAVQGPWRLSGWTIFPTVGGGIDVPVATCDPAEPETAELIAYAPTGLANLALEVEALRAEVARAYARGVADERARCLASGRPADPSDG